MAEFSFKQETTFEDVRARQKEFADERNWEQYHTPRNLALALVGEVVSNCNRKGEVSPGCPEFTMDERMHLAEELSDVQLYLIRLSERCGIDLPTAVSLKLTNNALKYPAKIVHGSSKKYTEYK